MVVDCTSEAVASAFVCSEMTDAAAVGSEMTGTAAVGSEMTGTAAAGLDAASAVLVVSANSASTPISTASSASSVSTRSGTPTPTQVVKPVKRTEGTDAETAAVPAATECADTAAVPAATEDAETAAVPAATEGAETDSAQTATDITADAAAGAAVATEATTALDASSGSTTTDAPEESTTVAVTSGTPTPTQVVKPVKRTEGTDAETAAVPAATEDAAPGAEAAATPAAPTVAETTASPTVAEAAAATTTVSAVPAAPGEITNASIAASIAVKAARDVKDARAARAARAAERAARRVDPTFKNEVRVGWGDPLFETLMYHNSVHYVYQNLPETMTFTEKSGFRYSGHFFAEYQRRLSRVWSVGCKVDWEKVSWNTSTYKGGSETVVASSKQYFCNFSITPGVRVNWLNRSHFGMYSQLGVGLAVNSGSESDYLGRTKIVAPAFDLCAVGAHYDYGHWTAAAEIGGLTAFNSGYEVLMVLSRMFSISVGYKF